MKKLLLVTSILLSASACAKSDHVAAIINGEKIKQSAVHKIYNALPDQLKKEESFQKIYPAILENTVINTVLLQEAKKSGIEHDSQYQEQLNTLKNTLLIQRYITKNIEPDITDALLQKTYNNLIHEIPAIKEAHILVITKSTKKSAEETIKKLIAGLSFESLMKNGQGKDLGYISEDHMQPSLKKVIFSLKNGQFTLHPIIAEGSFHIVKVVNKRLKSKPTFEELKPRLISLVSAQLTQKLVKKLSAQAKIQRFDLSGNPIQAPKQTNQQLSNK